MAEKSKCFDPFNLIWIIPAEGGVYKFMESTVPFFGAVFLLFKIKF